MKFEKFSNAPKYTEIIDTTDINSNDTPVFKYIINNKNLDNIISQTLEIDKSFRYVGVENDLFTSNELSYKNLDYIYPTLCTYNKNDKKTFDKSIIIKNLYYRFPIIQCMNMTNIVIAGGSIGNAIVNNRHNYNSDLDIFIYGVDEYGANTTIYRILDHLSKFSKDHQFNFIQTSNALTINVEKLNSRWDCYIRECTIQIIFRLYKTKSEILHSFDLGSSCVGYDGNDILFTTLSKFSYEHDCNIVDNTRRSTTYEKRLIKYHTRGFSIIMPSFDINKINLHDNLIVLQRLLVRPSKCYGNIITVKNMQCFNNATESDYNSKGFKFLNMSIDSLLDSKINIEWVKPCPSKMLSATFNAIEDTEFTWYGVYLLKPASMSLNWIKSLKRLFCGAF
jgi:hypothetical protein